MGLTSSSQSPDLNIIEDAWIDLKKAVHRIWDTWNIHARTNSRDEEAGDSCAFL